MGRNSSREATQAAPGKGGRLSALLLDRIRHWLAGSRAAASPEACRLALDILASNGVGEVVLVRQGARPVHVLTGDSLIAPEVLRTGSWDLEKMQAAVALIGSFGHDVAGLTFVNVGANIGTTCLNAYASGFRRLVAIEPEPQNFRLLGANLARLDGAAIRLVDAAIGEGPGTAELFRHRTNAGGHSLVNARPHRVRDSIAVRVDPLSAHLVAGEPFALFIDAEGYEPQVLAGAGPALMEDCRAIVMEVTPSRISAEWADDLACRIAAFARELVLLPGGDRRPVSDLVPMMAGGKGRQFDIAMVRNAAAGSVAAASP